MKFGNLRNDVFERRRSTGSGFFVFLRHDFEQMFGQIFSIRVKTNLLASRHIIIEKGPLTVDVRLSKTSLLKLPIAYPV